MATNTAKATELAKSNHNTAPAVANADTYVPRADFYEIGEGFVLQCDLPGVKAEDVELRFDHGFLSLHGKVHTRQQMGDPVNSEYGIGDFHRTFSIPSGVDTTRLSAECKLGVLTVHLPKNEQALSHKVTVKAG